MCSNNFILLNLLNLICLIRVLCLNVQIRKKKSCLNKMHKAVEEGKNIGRR